MNELEEWIQDEGRRWRGWTHELVQIAQRCKSDGGALYAKYALDAVAARYPSSSGSSDGVSSSDPSDSTGNRAARILDAPAAEMRRHLVLALEQLRLADDARKRAIVAGRDPRPPGRAEAPACVNCDRFEIYTPMTKASRCDACYQYRHKYNRDAPEHVIRARPGNSTPRELARDEPR